MGAEVPRPAWLVVSALGEPAPPKMNLFLEIRSLQHCSHRKITTAEPTPATCSKGLSSKLLFTSPDHPRA